MSRRKTPSNAVVLGGVSGTALAPLVLWGLSLAGMPIPADPMQAAGLGSAIGGLITGALSYLPRGGRKGESE